SPVEIREDCRIAHQSAQFSKRTECRNGGYSVLRRQFRDTFDWQAGLNDNGVGPLFHHVRKSRLKLFGAKHFYINQYPGGSAAGFAASAAGVNQVTIRSTLSRTSSAAISRRLPICPWSDRNSYRMLCPST